METKFWKPAKIKGFRILKSRFQWICHPFATRVPHTCHPKGENSKQTLNFEEQMIIRHLWHFRRAPQRSPAWQQC